MKDVRLGMINRVYHKTFANMKFNLVFREPRKGERYLGADGEIYSSSEGEVGTRNYRIILKEAK